MKVKQTVTLPNDDLEWYTREYPGISLSATLTLLLHEFRAIHKDVGATPKRVAHDAAKEIKSRIDEGIFEDTEGD